jgi:predicted Fe-Mo cluster-binding NifX family protein
MKKNITIKKNEENPESVELLAQSIIQVAEGFEAVLSSKLTQRALIVLLHDGIGTAKITKSQIKLVLENLPRLKAWYVKK